MVVAVEQKQLLIPGGLSEQPSWFVTLLAWFGPAYDFLKFMSRVKMVLGDDSKSSVNKAALGKKK